MKREFLYVAIWDGSRNAVFASKHLHKAVGKMVDYLEGKNPRQIDGRVDGQAEWAIFEIDIPARHREVTLKFVVRKVAVE